MATDLGRVAPAAASKYDAFVAEQLGKAEGRIRLLDLTAALLGFAALTLAYVVGMVVCDSKLELTPQTRQGTLYLFLAGSAIYLFFTVIRPLRLRVNPYYAARQVERQLPGAKNSIVNWVDLHTQPLPPAIRGALGQRAAKDLSRIDLDSAISGRRAAWAGGLAGLFALAFVVAFFLLGPSPFYSLLKRAFNPFGQGGVSTRTQLTILKPEGGDAVVTVGRGVYFVVEVTGKVPDPKAPDAVKLLYRYEDSEPWLERLLLHETDREWTAQLSALEVQNGFSYKITGGDATTDVYRVSVRAAPAVTDFLATYHYRPYVARADEVRRERPLKALRGTEVRLRVRTNRTLRDGRLDFEGKEGTKVVRGLPDPGDPHVLLVLFHLDEDGRYRLHFTSTEGEAYSDPAPYPVTAIPDLPPTVELTKPGQDIRLAADGMLHLEGKAGDDIGVKKLALQMEVVGGERFREQIYRGDDALRLADGGYPREVEYKDFVELSRVKNQQGQPVPLRPGMELEYWLEASDACDYPHANITSSKHFRVLLTEPEKNEAKRQQEKKQAEQDKKQHEQKQDQQLQQESQERRQERQEQEARNKEEQDKSNQADKGAAGDAPQKNEGGKGEGDDKGAQGDPNNGQGENQSGLSKEQQDIENRVKDALEKQQQGENGQGEGKPDKGDQGEGKGEPQNNQAGEKSEGEGKDAGQQSANQAGEGKDKGQPQPGGDTPQGDGKGDSSSKPMPGDKGESKGDQPMNQPGGGEASEGKNKGKSDAAPQAGEGKPGGDSQKTDGAGESKPQPAGQGQNASGAGESKPADGKGEQAKGGAAGEAKDNAGGNKRTEPKGPGDTKDDPRAEGKKGDTEPKGDSSSSGDSKPMNPGASENTSQGDAKPDAGTQARNATPKDVAEMAKDLQSGDAQKREEAKRQLERIAKEARDSQAREQAGEALDKAGQPDGPAEDTKPQPGNGSSGQSSDGKKGDKGGKSDGSKGEGGSGSGGKGDKGEGESNSQGQGEKRGKNNSTGSSTASSAQNREGSNTPGGGGNRRDSDNPAAAGGDSGSSSAATASKPRDHRAAQMQLDDFLKKVDTKILKDAGVSEEAWKKYLETRRKQLAPPDKPRAETPTDPRQAVQLPSMGGRTIQSPSSTPGDAQSSDRGQPPPGYRDRFREFSRQMSNKKN
jgi:hypothetical protein